MRYLKVWKKLTSNTFSSYASNRLDSFSYFLGKIIRFIFFLIMIFSVFRFTDNLVGYSKYEVIMFFLTFNLIDVMSQAFIRGIYLMRDDVVEGNFDYVLSKPINSLFYSLSRQTDILDFIFLVPIIALLIWTIFKLQVVITIWSVGFYLLFLCFSMVIVLALHILSGAFTLLTLSDDNIIWLYREAMGVGRFPPEIFSSNLQFVFTYIMPIFIIIAFPVKALLGQVGWTVLMTAILFSIVFLFISMLLWRVGIRKYSSASS